MRLGRALQVAKDNLADSLLVCEDLVEWWGGAAAAGLDEVDGGALLFGVGDAVGRGLLWLGPALLEGARVAGDVVAHALCSLTGFACACLRRRLARRGSGRPMALPGGLALLGHFVVVKNHEGDGYDEYYLVSKIDHADYLALSTTSDCPGDFAYFILELRAAPLEGGGWRMMNGMDPGRTPAMGVDPTLINHICHTAYLVVWSPDAVQQAALATEGSHLALSIRDAREAGAPDALPRVPLCGAPQLPALAALRPAAPPAPPAAAGPGPALLAGAGHAAPALGGPALGMDLGRGFGGPAASAGG